MIGMIALAGIVVRNSIILIDFIHHGLARGLEPAKTRSWKPARSACGRSR